MQKNFKEKLFLTFISYWITILLIRSFNFYYYVFRKNPIGYRIIINGIHFHHYLIGIFFVFIAGSMYYLLGKKNNFSPPLFLGIGTGLLFDEFSYWFNPQLNNYWVIENFFAIFVFGFFLFLLYLFPEKKIALDQVFVPKTPHKNPQNPFISVVIPALNEEKFLGRTLQSILNQDFKDFELIVVDNNSTDKTSEIAKNFGAKVIFESQLGVGFARQKGFSKAKGKIIASTDADTILPSNWLSRIMKEFEKDKNLVAFGGLYTLYSGPITARSAVSYFAYPVWVLDRILSGGWSLTGSNLAIKKEAFLKVGGFKTELKLGEDADISQRLKKIGKVILDPDFLVQTSGRRFRNGLFHGLITYAPNGLIRMFFKKERFNKLPTIRDEKSLLPKLSFLSLFFLAIFLFSLFYFSNPQISQAKDIKLIKEKIVFVKNEIQKKRKRLKIL